MRRCLGLTCLLLLAATAGARVDDDFETDRPDLAEGPGPVSAGHLQVEAGWTRAAFTRHSRQDVVGEVLVRIGIAPHLELRGVLPSWNRLALEQPAPTREMKGFDAAGMGLKVGVPLASQRFALGVLSHVIFPGGSGTFRSDRTNFDVLVAGAYALARSSLSANAGVQRSDGAWGEFAVVSLSADIGARMGGYVESAVEQVDGESQWTWDTGVTWRPVQWTQLDARVGAVSGFGETWAMFGAGISQRW